VHGWPFGKGGAERMRETWLQPWRTEQIEHHIVFEGWLTWVSLVVLVPIVVMLFASPNLDSRVAALGLVMVSGVALVAPQTAQGLVAGAIVVWQLGLSPESDWGWCWACVGCVAVAFAVTQGAIRRWSFRASQAIGIVLWTAWCAGGFAIGGSAAGALAGFAIGLLSNQHAIYRAVFEGVALRWLQRRKLARLRPPKVLRGGR
jgi:hypothetical protein